MTTTPPRHRKSDWPPRWVLFLMSSLAVIGFLWLAFDNFAAKQEARDANTNAEVLAQEVQEACAEGDVILADGRSLCERAVDVEQEAQEGVGTEGGSRPGPIGPPGPPGTDGRDGTDGSDSNVPGPPGSDSDVPGPAGDPGQNGADSTVPGPEGQAGSDGADSTIPGPPGADGQNGADGGPGEQGPQGEKGDRGDPGADGQDGQNGEDGTDGRGIASVQCTDDGWIVTYTDGTTENAGACRAPAAPDPDPEPGPEPTP